MIVNRVPLLKPRNLVKQYELWWGYPDGDGGVVDSGTLEEISLSLENYIDYYEEEYYCSDWEPGVRARLRHREFDSLQWIFEIKESK